MIKWILIILGILIALVVSIRLLVKWTTSGEGLLKQTQGALSFLNACIKRLAGGGDDRC